MEDTKYHILKDYKLHLTILIFSIISLIIGTINIQIGEFNLILLPIMYALFLSIILYIIKRIKWIGKIQSKNTTKLILILISPLIVKLAIASGQNIELLFNVGPVLILKELGTLGTIIIGLPIALLLGFGRESIGMTSSICREPQLAVLINRYGFDSIEVKGFFIVYLIGIILGTVFISILTNILTYLIPLHPYSYALASGIGSTSLNVAALSSLTVLYPELTDKLLAFSGISNLISVMLSIYVYSFIALPLTEKLYDKLNRKQQ